MLTKHNMITANNTTVNGTYARLYKVHISTRWYTCQHTPADGTWSDVSVINIC